jgi:hypothetical protein
MKKTTLAVTALAVLLGLAAPAASAQLPAHGYVCSVTYFPQPSVFVGQFGSAVVLVSAQPRCTGAQTQLNIYTVGSNQNVAVKLSEAALLNTVAMLRQAAIENMRVNIVYDSVGMSVLWFNFFAQ